MEAELKLAKTPLTKLQTCVNALRGLSSMSQSLPRPGNFTDEVDRHILVKFIDERLTIGALQAIRHYFNVQIETGPDHSTIIDRVSLLCSSLKSYRSWKACPFSRSCYVDVSRITSLVIRIDFKNGWTCAPWNSEDNATVLSAPCRKHSLISRPKLDLNPPAPTIPSQQLIRIGFTAKRCNGVVNSGQKFCDCGTP